MTAVPNLRATDGHWLLLFVFLVLATPGAQAVDLGAAFNQVHSLNNQTLQYPELSGAGAPTALKVGDFNCDGRADLAVGLANANFVVGGTFRAQAGALAYALGNETAGLAPIWRSIRQGDAIASGALEAGDEFGFALAAADFDGDGCDELAIGVPGEDTVAPVAQDAGQVLVLKGAASGLVGSGRAYLPAANSTGNNGVVAGHRKGFALATPRRMTSASSRPYLAIGAPDHNGFPVTQSGGVSIRRQGSSGILTSVVAFRERFHLPNEALRWGDIFGYNMVHGNFNGDGFDDLVAAMLTKDGCRTIGIPSFCLFNDGALGVLYGGSTTNFNAELIHRDLPGVAGSPELFAKYGEALAVGDFDGDGFDDLAIGSPHQLSTASGRVSILYGSSSGLLGARSRSMDFSLGSLPGQAAVDGDRFGAALAVGDFNADGFEDLAIGAPGRLNGRGRVLVIYGSETGLRLDRVTELGNGLSGMPPSAADQRFGSVLAAGDFNNDGADDLAVVQENSPRVQILYASAPTALSATTPSPSIVGQTYRVTMVARRQDVGNALRARGSVRVQDDLGNQCSDQLSPIGIGRCSLPGQVVGERTLTVTYDGVIGFQPATTVRSHMIIEEPDLIYADRFQPSSP